MPSSDSLRDPSRPAPSALRGEYRDRLLRPGRPAIDFGVRHNVVVDQCRQLLAAFMLGGPAAGIAFMALGRGDAAWDGATLPSPSAATLALVDATPVVIDAADMSLTFVDAAGLASAAPSPRIEASLELQGADLPISGDATYPLREFALFGRLGATPYMIDYVRHGVMHLGVSDVLSRRVRLIF